MKSTRLSSLQPPAIGERRARWGYGYQDKVATERILSILKQEIRDGTIRFQGVRLADLDAWRVDDFVLVWDKQIEGNSIKWSSKASPINWADLIGSKGLLKELAQGYQRLKERWPNKDITVRLQTNRPPSNEKHSAQLIAVFSVDEFLKKYWQTGPTSHDSAEIKKAWQKISQHIGLRNKLFKEFIDACTFDFDHAEPPGSAPNTTDWQHYIKQFDSLHKEIATWITNNPNSDFINQKVLLSSIGYRPLQFKLLQRFPLPDIPYSKNHKAAKQLEKIIDTFEGGYIAVVGPAGSGKSTLVQHVLSDAAYPLFFPYFAFIPRIDGNRDRSEALTFFQDIITRLDKIFPHRYSLGVDDIYQAREALREHMAKAHEQYILHGLKTIILIDGLDHVLREANLQISLLHELPHPEEIPNGFLIILSTQPQALKPDSINQLVSNQITTQPGRKVFVSGLSRAEIHNILNQLPKSCSGTEKDLIYDVCQGNPLILRYIINIYQKSSHTTVKEAINFSGQYSGDIEQYYRSSFAVQLQNAETRRLLGLICRSAPVMPVNWLLDWPEREKIEDLYECLLMPFMKEEEGNLQFIHNSLISFLMAETRTLLPGSDAKLEEQRFHAILAKRCGDRPCLDPLGRARVHHLLIADQNREVLSVLSSNWLRQAIESFLPYSLFRPYLLAGFEAAWKLQDIGELLRLLLLDNELEQRSSRLECSELAIAFLELDKPELAISQIRSLGRLLAKDAIALEFAKDLRFYANEHSSSQLKNIARSVYSHAKPISYIYQSDPIDVMRQHEYKSILRAWSEAAPLFENVDSTIVQIKQLKFVNLEKNKSVDEADTKAYLLFGILKTLLQFELRISDCKRLINQFSSLNKRTWRFAALLQVAIMFPSHVSYTQLTFAHKQSRRNADLDLAFAAFLDEQGHQRKAKSLVKAISHIRFNEFQNPHSFGFSDISFTITLSRLQVSLGIPEGAVPGVENSIEEAYARIESTARKLGRLRADSKILSKNPTLNEELRSLLLFHNKKIEFSKVDRRNNYVLEGAKKEIYKEIARLVSDIGNAGQKEFRDAVLKLLNEPTGSQFSAQHRRFFAESLFDFGVVTGAKAKEIGLSSVLDTKDEDPDHRQKACIEIAIFLHKIGEHRLSEHWLARAGKVSAGAGSNKDYHMLNLADWLIQSEKSCPGSVDISVLEKFARAIKVAGGDGASRAAQKELELLVQLAPSRALKFFDEMIDREVLYISEALEAMLLGAATSGASSEILSSIYCEMLSLIAPAATSEVAVRILDQFPLENRIAAAKRIMQSVRTNSLPSYRVQVARALEDKLRYDELGDVVISDELCPGQDDNSKNRSLYKFRSGEYQTIDRVAVRLSNHNPNTWNPNANENKDFDWCSAIIKAKVISLSHMNDLVTILNVPDYKKCDILVWKSNKYLQLGDGATARKLAEEAIALADTKSWHDWIDGAQKKVAFSALKLIDKEEAISRASKKFGKDLAAGNIYPYYLLHDIIEIFEFLELEWPSNAVNKLIRDYLDNVLQANHEISSFASMSEPSENLQADEALCRLLINLLAFPVVDVGVAARRSLAQCFNARSDIFISIFTKNPCCDSVQFEHILAALHTCVIRTGNNMPIEFKVWLQKFNSHESISVRNLASTLCNVQGWQWEQISNLPRRKIILLPEAINTPANYDDTCMLLNGDIAKAFKVHENIIAVLEDWDLVSEELKSEYYLVYREIEKDYTWKDKKRLKHWIKSVRARHWLAPRAFIGREAAMRVLGRRTLSGQAPSGLERSIHYLNPIYDPNLELLQPIERPIEFRAMEWHFNDDRKKAWLNGENANSWNDYPESIDGYYIIGERTFLIRPEWDWPREERYRGLAVGPCDSKLTRKCLESRYELSLENYLRGDCQDDEQLIILNSERQLVGSVYRWTAINSIFARSLGWRPSAKEPFAWTDSSGNMMVKSVYWKDGWIWLEPPRFESLGEGWIVLVTKDGLEKIKSARDNLELHLWAERFYNSDDLPNERKWHLSKIIC